MNDQRILLIAEAANPEWVSVPLVGWSHATEIARRRDALIVTQVRNREAFLRAGLVEGSDFVAIDSERVARPLFQLGNQLNRLGLGWTARTLTAMFAYYEFERLVCKRFSYDLFNGRFSLVHRITPLSPAIPSFFLSGACKRAGVPLVIGPINGGVPWPKDFKTAMADEGEWLSLVRSAYRLMPGYSRTLRFSSAILAGSRTTASQIPQRYREKTFYLPENAISPDKFSPPLSPPPRRPIRIAFVGRLVPLKGVDMILDACAALAIGEQVVLNIYGDGPERLRLEMLCDRLKMGSAVNFHGWVNHEDLIAHLQENHVLVFPSIREFGGGVILEAMAVGVVPIVVNYGGPGELVSPASGFAVPLGSRSVIVSEIRAVLQKLVDDPHILDDMRAAGMARVERHFTWHAKAQKVLAIYSWVLGDQSQRPDVGDDVDLSHETAGINEESGHPA